MPNPIVQIFRAEIADFMSKAASVRTELGALAAADKELSASIAVDARANIEARVKEATSLTALRAEYKATAEAATKGSAEQVVAAKLAQEATSKLAATGVVMKQDITSAFGSAAQAATGISAGMLGLGAAASVAALGIAKLGKDGVDAYSSLGAATLKLQLATGGTAEQSSALVYILGQVGVGTDQAATSFARFGKNIQDNEKKFVAHGVAIEKNANGTVNYAATLENLRHKYQQTTDASERDAMQMDLLGRGAATMAGYLHLTDAEVKVFTSDMEKLGLSMSQKDVDATRAFNFSMQELHQSIKGFEVSVARELVPALTDFDHILADVISTTTQLHLPIVPVVGLGVAASAATLGVKGLGIASGALGAEWAGSIIGSLATGVGEVVLITGAVAIASRTVDDHVAVLKKVDGAFVDWERKIPVVGGLLADLDHATTGAGKSTDDMAGKIKAAQTAFEAQGIALSNDEAAMLADDKQRAALLNGIASFEKKMTNTAASVGLSVDGMKADIGIFGTVAPNDFDKVTAAADKFAKAVDAGVRAASASFAKDTDAVSYFSASQIKSRESAAASAAKSANGIVTADTRVADAEQHVADLTQEYADSAAKAKEAYAAKVDASNQRVADSQDSLAQSISDTTQRVADAESRLADTIETNNQRVRDADQRLADDRISLAQSVADAQARLADDHSSGLASIADAQQRLTDLQNRQAVQGNPAATKALNDQIALRDAKANVVKAQEAAADREKSDLDAIGKAKERQIKTLEKDEDAAAKARVDQIKNVAKAQEEADKARVTAAKDVERAEDAVTKAKAEQAKLQVEGLTVGQETIQQQAAMRKAIEAVGTAQRTVAADSIKATGQVGDAIGVSVDDVAAFYKKSAEGATTFERGIHDAIAQGYDPIFIADLLKEGPTQAAPIIQAIVSDHAGVLKGIVNDGEAATKRLSDLNIETAHATQVAINSTNADVRSEFHNAMAIIEAEASAGGTLTAQNLADKLGVGVAAVQKIANDYGISMANGLNPLLYGLGAPQVTVTTTGGVPAGVYVGGMAVGGQVPGTGSGDIVPAMLEPGEFVIRKAAVQAMGLDALFAINAKRFATGGFVNAGDVPPVPDYSAYGNMLGYSGTKADTYLHNKVVDFLNAHPSAMGGSSGGPPGSVPTGQVADWVAAGVNLAGKPGSWVPPEINIAMFESSGDPNAINLVDSNAAAGTPSKGLMQVIDPTFQANMVPGHGDIWNPIDNVAAASNYIAGRYGDPSNTPGERSLARGGGYLGYEAGGLVKAASFDQGGWLQPGLTLAHNGTGAPEQVGGGSTMTIQQVIINLPDVTDPRAAAVAVRDELLRYQRANGNTGLR